MPRFSIIIPTRQRADTLMFAIRTALAQTHHDFEVVVQNNGNDPATNDVVAAFATRRIVLNCSDEVLPMAANWEAALTASSGEYVTFIGDDDGLMPEACEICDEVMSSRPSLGALHWAAHVYDWPNSLHIAARNRLVVALPGRDWGKIHQSRDLLQRMYDSASGWANGPVIYNGSFVRRSVIEKVKAFCGGQYFVGDFPDIHSTIANLWAMEQFLHIETSLSICGFSGHSHGNALFLGSVGDDIQKRFRTESPAFHQALSEHFLGSTNFELAVTCAMMMAKEIFLKDEPGIALNMRNALLRMGFGANRDPERYDQTIAEMQQVARKYGIDTSSFNLPPKMSLHEVAVLGPLADATGRTTSLAVSGAQAGIETIAGAVTLARLIMPPPAAAHLNAVLPRSAVLPPPLSLTEIPVGLSIPHQFRGLRDRAGVAEGLRLLIARAGNTSDPHGDWFMADNLITFAHTRGFLTDPRFVAAVSDELPSEDDLAIAWRTHTLCWAAENCLEVPGDYVECGSRLGYSMAVVLRYLAGLPGRKCYLYDLFDSTGGAGEGKDGRLATHASELFETVRARFRHWPNVLVTCGKVPDVLAHVAPASIAFLHACVDDVPTERGMLDALFDRISPGGMIVLDDYGWGGCRDLKLAADVFMRDRALAVLELPTGQGLVVKR